MRNLPSIELLAELASVRQRPCLALYQPTHRHHPENQQDRIQFRNLVKEAQASLQQKYPDVETRRLLQPFEALAQEDVEERQLWQHYTARVIPIARENLSIMFDPAHTACRTETSLHSCSQIAKGESTMKRTALRTRERNARSIAWDEVEYAALWGNSADTCDDRVSDDIFDVEDEHAEVDMIVRAMISRRNAAMTTGAID